MRTALDRAGFAVAAAVPALVVAVLAAVEPLAAIAVVLALLAALLMTASMGVRTRAAVCGLAIVPAIGGFADVDSDTPAAIRLVDDCVLAAGLVLLVASVRVLPERARGLAGAGLLALLVSELGGVFATHGTVASGLGGAWQDLRWVGIFGWGLWLARHVPFRERGRWAFRVAVAWAGLTAAVTLAQVAFGLIVEYRLSIPTAQGIFGHPVPGSLAAAMAIVFAITDAASEEPVLTRREKGIAVVAGFAAVAVTLRFQVFLALAAVLLLVWLRRQPLSELAAALAVVAVPLLVMATLLGLSAATAGFSGVSPGDSASSTVLRDVSTHAPSRVRLTEGARHLAGESAPFGWGLGTYGSALDPALESEAFQAAGLLGIYGFGEDVPDYRSDNYLAHVLGERGYAGFALWVVGVVLLLAAAIAGSGHLLPAAAMASALATAPFGPALKSGPYMFIVLLAGALLLGRARPAEPSVRAPS